MKRKLIGRVIYLLCLCLFAAGCSRNRGFSPDPDSPRLRRPSPLIEAVNLTISKKTYDSALRGSGSLNKIRLIQIYTRGNETAGVIPEYRMFDIQPGSVYSMLGLATGDVLVTANDYMVVNPSTFPTYVSLLRNEKSGQIEIRREGKPLLLRYTFIE